MLKQRIETIVKDALAKSLEQGKLGQLTTLPELVPVELPKNPEHGDKAISIAMKLSKEAKIAPRMIAEAIATELGSKVFSKVEVAGPGFINLTLDWDLLEESIAEIFSLDLDYGRIAKNDRADKSFETVIVEYVSANPTGDLHLGHGRQAVLGSALVDLLRWAGYDASSEFYINDAGVQMGKLAASARQAILIKAGELGESDYDEENNYPFAAMKEILSDKKWQDIESQDMSSVTAEDCGKVAKEIFLESQKEILKIAGTEFECWYSELENLHQGETTKVDVVCQKMLEAGIAYESEGALWFKATEFGDERDRVLRKTDGYYTYLAADLAYHQDKLSRADRLINLWGADHHGQIPGVMGALEALGEDPKRLEIVLMQMVSLTKGGEEVKMSKRTGNFVTVRELIEEVGVDAFRYFLLECQPNNRIVFDLELATKQDKDNPVYYVQYAHARCCGILRNLTEKQVDQTELPGNSLAVADGIMTEAELDQYFKTFTSATGLYSRVFANLSPEQHKSTKALILVLLNFPEEVKDAAASYAPYRIANYIKELAALFHQFYTHNRVINDDAELMKARISLVAASQKVLRNGLGILGINAPERM
ncbi:MAG: arginine--tRNA ligase [Cyanobacteria bacterium]|nr:arginine--tRNA ligase [Cyanobacteriota bacterium]MDA1020392.1 arginine--tRNA ligase [Cyanobacteriota bacterium]